MKYLAEARQIMSKDPDAFADQEPFLYGLLTNENLSDVERHVLVTEIYQGGIDAVRHPPSTGRRFSFALVNPPGSLLLPSLFWDACKMPPFT